MDKVTEDSVLDPQDEEDTSAGLGKMVSSINLFCQVKQHMALSFRGRDSDRYCSGVTVWGRAGNGGPRLLAVLPEEIQSSPPGGRVRRNGCGDCQDTRASDTRQELCGLIQHNRQKGKPTNENK